MLETFCDRALQSDYSPWESFNVHGYDNNRTELEKSYKTVRVANDMESSSSLGEPVFISVKLPDQRRRPAEGPRVDIWKTHFSAKAELVTGKLRSKRKTCDAESS